MRISTKAITCFMADQQLTTAALAEKAGISNYTASKIASGKTDNVQITTAGAIAAALGVKTADIIAE